MSLEKQCAKCSLQFSNSNIYCPRCGTYWEQGKHNRSLAGGVFGRNQQDDIMTPFKGTKESIKPKSKINIICPACKKEIPVEEDASVITCCRCGELIDCKEAQKVTNQILFSSDELLSINKKQIITSAATDQRPPLKKNPLDPSTKSDDSIISFICLRSCGNIPLPNVNDNNKIVLGTEGNYAEFFSDPMFKGIEKEQAVIIHERSGWYMYPKGANLRLNNIPIPVSSQQHSLILYDQQDALILHDNDKIYLGNCLLQVEIRPRKE